MLINRPTPNQHLWSDKGYKYPDVHQFVTEQGYQKHRNTDVGEASQSLILVPLQAKPSFRLEMGRGTYPGLAKRDSVCIRWCKKSQNWLSFIYFTCASILADMAIFG